MKKIRAVELEVAADQQAAEKLTGQKTIKEPMRGDPLKARDLRAKRASN